jgi:hypothetical protein
LVAKYRPKGNPNLYQTLIYFDGIAIVVVVAQAMYINVGGASDYWFTAGPTCVPGGPHFSFSYYLTIASVAGKSLCSSLVPDYSKGTR